MAGDTGRERERRQRRGRRPTCVFCHSPGSALPPTCWNFAGSRSTGRRARKLGWFTAPKRSDAMASRPVTFVAGVLAGAALTSLYSTQPARHEVPAPVASAAAAPGLAMPPDGFSSAASGPGHPPADSALTADEGEGDEGEARSVPQLRPCSVGWRGASVQGSGLGLGLGSGASVLCTRALSKPKPKPKPTPTPKPNPKPYPHQARRPRT